MYIYLYISIYIYIHLCVYLDTHEISAGMIRDPNSSGLRHRQGRQLEGEEFFDRRLVDLRRAERLLMRLLSS